MHLLKAQDPEAMKSYTDKAYNRTFKPRLNIKDVEMTLAERDQWLLQCKLIDSPGTKWLHPTPQPPHKKNTLVPKTPTENP